MDAMDSFQRELEQRLAAAEQRLADEQKQLSLEMAVLSARHEEYERVATSLVDRLLLPRVSALANRFQHARLAYVEGQLAVGIDFRHSERFPATVKLQMGVTHDDRVQSLVAFYDASILPIFMEFQRHDQATWKLEAVDESEFTSWVESHLISFLDTYLRIEEVDQYQQETLCTDPVCGMRIRKSAAATSVEHQGITYYFCVESCREAFESEPSRYVVK